MYVCLCNCVTDHQLVAATAQFASETGTTDSSSIAEQIADRLGAGLGCGSCRQFALDLVERAATQQVSLVLSNCVQASADRDTAPAGQRDLPYPVPAVWNKNAVAHRGS